MNFVRLHYYKSENFGDALSPKLVEKLSGRRMGYADPYKADLVAVGSVLYTGHWLFRNGVYNRTVRGAISFLRLKMKTCRTPIKIWGSGFLEYPKFPSIVDVVRAAEVCALRGKVSHQIMDRLGLCPLSQEIAYGDPGLLYPLLLESMPAKEYDIGIVPHYFDKENGVAIFDSIRKTGAKAALIDVLGGDPVRTVREIAKCEAIISSSLHGCIVSDGMGIPNRQMTLSTLSLAKEDYFLKFKDYYSAFGIDMPKPFEVTDLDCGVATLLARIRREYCVPNDEVARVKNDLKASFPL